MKPHLLVSLVAFHLLPAPGAGEEAPGPAGKPVGMIGRSHRIEFKGNEVFTDRDLRRALASDTVFLSASRPAEPMAEMLVVLKGRLIDGYRSSGCPNARIDVSYRPDHAEHPILVEVEEGERYRQGKIIVRGPAAGDIDREALIKALARNRSSDQKQLLLKRVRHVMEWSPPVPLPEKMASGPEPLEKSSRTIEASWQPGEPVPFVGSKTQPRHVDVSYHLAEQGHANARFNTRHETREDGTADLVIEIDDLGPSPVIGQIIIDGAQRFEREEILRLVGLKPGQAVRPGHLDDALLALWRSGRFHPFAIDAQQRAPGAAEIDFRLRLNELEDVPDLDTPLAPEQMALTRFIEWVNRGMDGEEMVLTLEGPEKEPVRLTVGWALDLGLLVEFEAEKHEQKLTLYIAKTGLSLLMDVEGQQLTGEIPASLSETEITVLPTLEEKPLSVGLKSGFATESLKRNPNGFFALLTPAAPLLNADKCVRKGDQAVIDDFLVLDLETGMPEEIKNGSVKIGTGWLKERVEQIRERMAEPGDKETSIAAWHAALSTILEKNLPEEKAPGEVREFTELLRNTADITNRLGQAGTFQTVGDLLELMANRTAAGSFDIPTEFEGMVHFGGSAVLVRIGLLAALEECFPAVDWPLAFARERMLTTGLAGGVGENLEIIAEDPSLGPLGALLCARMLGKANFAMSQKFLRRAGEAAGVDGFRRDWHLVLDPSSLLAEQMKILHRRLATLPPEEQEEIAALLPEGMDAALGELLEILRSEPDEIPSEDLLAPPMARLWKDDLGTRLEEYLQRHLLPEADPATAAATLNGRPVSRGVVRVLREMQLPLLDALPLPLADENREWTRDPALAAAIRMTMLVESRRAAVEQPLEELGPKVADQMFSSLAGKDNAVWLEKLGYTREQMGEWSLAFTVTSSFLKSISEELPKRPDDVTLGTHFEEHRELFQSRWWADMVFIKQNLNHPKESARCHRLATALAGAPEELPLELVGRIADRDDPSGCRIFPRVGVLADMFPVGILDALGELEPGRATRSIELGGGVAAVRLHRKEMDPAIDLAEVRGIVEEHWRLTRTREAAEKWFRQREAGLQIELLENPNPPDGGKLSAFQELKLKSPESELGRILTAWEQLGSEDGDEASQAIDLLFAEVGEEPSIVEEYAGKKRSHELLPCFVRAVKVDPEKTELFIERTIKAHANHGPGCEVSADLRQLQKTMAGEEARPEEP